MNNELRILVHFSPLLEEMLIQGKSDEVFLELKNCVDVIEKFKHSSLLVIPNEAIGYFYSDTKLRVLYGKIGSNTQINVLFINLANYNKCIDSYHDMYPGYPYSTNTHLFTNFALQKNKAFVLFDHVAYSYSKNKCIICDEGEACHIRYNFTALKIKNASDLKQMFLDISGKTLDEWSLNKNSIKESDLKGLAFLQAILYGADDNHVQNISKYKVTGNFIDDLKKFDIKTIIDSSFCMFRATSYPSVQTPDYHKLSIDWHRNNPDRMPHSEYKLYRVDVLGAQKTGLRGSGAVRLLMAIKGNDTHFIMATDSHDFCKKTIRERVALLP